MFSAITGCIYSIYYWSYILVVFFIPLLALISYLVPVILTAYVFEEQNLKTKYKAHWALVTGGSSGLGKALCEKLAKHGLNVVVVALEDKLLDGTVAELQKAYPDVEIRKVGVNLASHTDNYDYLSVIAKATEDIDIQIIFNNAGYLIIRGFVKTELTDLMANVECNVLSHVRVAHLFMKRMIERKLKGSIVFTSSQAAFFPAPSSAMYGSGKAFLSALAASLAIEAQPYGIDVNCIMSGPMMTNFYQNLPKLEVLKFFFAISATPASVASTMLKTVGRLCWTDASLYTVATRLVIKIVDMNLLVMVIAFGQRFTADYKNHPELH